jgi:hypothetical protein
MSGPTLIDHLEEHLGAPARTFEPLSPRDHRPFQVISFEGTPFPDATTLVTAGLSARPREQSKGHNIRQELVAATYRSRDEEELAAVVDAIGREVLTRDSALLRGEVVGPAGPIFAGSTIEAFAYTSPWYWSDEFSRFSGLSPAVLMIWLLPLTTAEAGYVRQHGIDRFEVEINEQVPDLLDFRRPSIV